MTSSFFLHNDLLFFKNYLISTEEVYEFKIKNFKEIKKFCICSDKIYFLRNGKIHFLTEETEKELENIDWIEKVEDIFSQNGFLIIKYRKNEDLKFYFSFDKSIFSMKETTKLIYSFSRSSKDLIFLQKNELHFFRNFTRKRICPEIVFPRKFEDIVDISLDNKLLCFSFNYSKNLSTIFQIKNSSVDITDPENLKLDDMLILNFYEKIVRTDLFESFLLIKFKKNKIKIFRNEEKIDLEKYLKDSKKLKEKCLEKNIKLKQFLSKLEVLEDFRNFMKNCEEYFVDFLVTDKIYLMTNHKKIFAFNFDDKNKIKLSLLDFRTEEGFFKHLDDNFYFKINNNDIFLNEFKLPKLHLILIDCVIFKLENEFLYLKYSDNFFYDTFKINKSKNMRFSEGTNLKLSTNLYFLPENFSGLFEDISEYLIHIYKVIDDTIHDFEIVGKYCYVFSKNKIFIFEKSKLIGFFDLRHIEYKFLHDKSIFLYQKELNNYKIIEVSFSDFKTISLPKKLTSIEINDNSKTHKSIFRIYSQKISKKGSNIFKDVNDELIKRKLSLKHLEEQTGNLVEQVRKYKKKTENVLKKFILN